MVLSLRTKSRRQLLGGDLAQPHVELIDFWGHMLWVHGQASVPRKSAVCSQLECTEPPLCDGLVAGTRSRARIQYRFFRRKVRIKTR
jgi:hypothetical protein